MAAPITNVGLRSSSGQRAGAARTGMTAAVPTGGPLMGLAVVSVTARPGT